MLTIFFIFINPFIPINFEENRRLPILFYQPAPPFLLGFLNDIDDMPHPDVILALLRF